MRAARSTHAAVPLVQDADGDLRRDRFTAAAFAPDTLERRLGRG